MSRPEVVAGTSDLAGVLSREAAARLGSMTSAVRAEPHRIADLFPAAAREVARGPADPADPRGLLAPTLDDAVRGALLDAYADATEGEEDVRLREVVALYRYGDADEKRAVLRALHRLRLGAGALPLVHDALRTNDTRLVAAALGPYSAEHLDPEAWRQGVLKCLFVGVPVAAVAGLDRRADADLHRMATAYAEERRAAGRDVPPDVHTVLAASATASAPDASATPWEEN